MTELGELLYPVAPANLQPVKAELLIMFYLIDE